MEPIFIFIMMVIPGFLLGLAAFKLYRLELYRKEQEEREQLENEIIEGLIQLKKCTATNVSSVASDK